MPPIEYPRKMECTENLDMSTTKEDQFQLFEKVAESDASWT